MSYSMTTGEVLQSKVIAKLRQPINSVLCKISATGTYTFEVTKDDSNWVEVTPDTKYTFISGSNDDELKYRVTALDNVIINKISIDINKP